MRYHMPTEIVFGPGAIAEVGAMVKDKLRSTRPLLVTDKGIIGAGIVQNVFTRFPGLPVYDEIEPNPRDFTVDRGGELARKSRADLIIGLGGGSVLDAAKAIALLATNPGKIEVYEGRERYSVTPLPVVAIPTTCGTGSEVTWVAVITHTGRRFKMSIKGTRMYPAVALVDPDLLVSLPAPLVASTGLDALTHAIEALTAKPATPISDTLALEAVRLIFRHLRAASPDIRADAEARAGLMMGSLFAGMAFGNSDVGAVHCLAEAIGSLYDTPHGVANAVFLPFVMEFNLKAAERKYAEMAAAIGISEISPAGAAAGLIQKVKALSQTLSIPSFRDLGIPEADFLLIAQKCFENNSNPSNPRPAGVDDYLGILRRAAAAVA